MINKKIAIIVSLLICVGVLLSLGVYCVNENNFNKQIEASIHKDITKFRNIDNVEIQSVVDVIKINEMVICIFVSENKINIAYFDKCDSDFSMKKLKVFEQSDIKVNQEPEFVSLSAGNLYTNFSKKTDDNKSLGYFCNEYNIDAYGKTDEYIFNYKTGEEINYPIYVNFSTIATMRLVEDDFLSCFIDEDNVIYIAKETKAFVENLPNNYDLNKLYDQVKTLQDFNKLYKNAEIEHKQLDIKKVKKINDLICNMTNYEIYTSPVTPHIRYSIGNSRGYTMYVDNNIFSELKYHDADESNYSEEAITANTALKDFFNIMNDIASWDFPNPYDYKKATSTNTKNSTTVLLANSTKPSNTSQAKVTVSNEVSDETECKLLLNINSVLYADNEKDFINLCSKVDSRVSLAKLLDCKPDDIEENFNFDENNLKMLLEDKCFYILKDIKIKHYSLSDDRIVFLIDTGKYVAIYTKKDSIEYEEAGKFAFETENNGKVYLNGKNNYIWDLDGYTVRLYGINKEKTAKDLINNMSFKKYYIS